MRRQRSHYNTDNWQRTTNNFLLSVCICVHLWLFPVFASVATHAAPPDPEQKRVAESFVAKNVMGKIVYDDAGNVIKLAISNHAAFMKDRNKPVPPGVTDAEFRDILKLPHLQAIFLEMQPIGDESYALLKQLKKLTDVRLHYPYGAKQKPGSTAKFAPDFKPATEDFALCLNDLPGLKVLQLKHIFSVPGDGIGKLKPQPELEHVELDTICATGQALPFLEAAPKIKNLQMHRTSITDAEFQELCAALPNLEVLEFRPSHQSKDNPITGKSLRGLKHCKKLRLLNINLNWKEMPFEGGLDVLATLPSLQQVGINPADIKDFTLGSPKIQKLHKARPDLLIIIGPKTLGGKPDQQRQGVDDGYDWGGQVTTHG